MGIYRLLRQGQLRFDADLRQLEVIGINGLALHRFSYEALSADRLWGQVYEIHVGRCLERDGYTVTYRGATLGFLDGGVDLIAEKDGEKTYLQCKHLTGKKLSKAEIEKMLFAASTYLHRQYAGKRLEFRVVVPSLANAFGRGPPVRKKGRDEVDLYWLRYLLAKNGTQSRVRIEVLELPMPLSAIDHAQVPMPP